VAHTGSIQTGQLHAQTTGRRYVSTLFADVVSSTDVVRHLDPEQFERFMKLYQSICDQVVGDFGGKIIEVLGDGIVAMFTGNENSTESAVRAGDELLTSIDELRPFESPNGALKLKIRVGISSGEGLVTSNPETRSQRILGPSTYLASRLQSLAKADQVLVCAQTYDKTRGLFDYCRYPVEQLQLKGFTDIQEVWCVKGPNEDRFRFDASKRINLSPLVGREELMNALLSRWELVTQKQGQVALIKGPPGIGKSRIFAELQHRVQRHTPNLITLCYQCSNYVRSSPLFPVMKQISRAMQIHKHDSASTINDKLNGLLDSWEDNKEIFNPVLLPLVLNTQQRDGESGLDPKQIDFAIRACTQLPLRFTRKAPVLVIIEDMHWADVASQKLLISSIRKAENKSIMIVVSYRTGEVEIPEYDEHYVSEFSMKRLSGQKSETLFDSINIGVPLSVIQKQDILEKCEGVPLFLEELTLNAIRNSPHENGRVYLETPSTLFDLFIQRYDSYEPQVKAVAQLAAVIGQEFKPKIIEAILGLRQQQCAHIIDILGDKDQIYKTDQNSNWYQFKHALIRGAIYDNTLNQDKYRLHKAVYDQLNSGDRIRSAIMMRRIAHHHKMLMFYAAFKKAN
jgi:class 3 adenylate cyclase